MSGTIHHQLAENQNWNGTSVELLKSVTDIKIMDNFTEPLNLTDTRLSDDILNVFINPQLQMKTEVLIEHFIRIRVDLIGIPGTILAGGGRNIDSLCSGNLL